MSLEHMLQDEREALRFWLDEAQREGEFSMELQEIEQRIQERLVKLQLRFTEGFERPSWDEWLDCYNALIACKQAQAAEKRIEQADTQNALLLRLCIAVECLENVGH